jgi:hypothetical protein
MKKSLCKTLLMACLAVPCLYSLDLQIYGGLGNHAFDTETTSTLGRTGEIFSPQYFPLIFAQLSGELDGLAFNAGFERDPLMRNRLFGNFKLDLEYIVIEAGPMLGVFNSPELLFNPGVSTGLKLQLPGIVFAQGTGSSTLAFISSEKTGNYSQYSGDLAAGFWVPYVICSLNMSIRNFSFRESENLLIEDESRRYFFKADVYTKNVPYTIRVDLGYQSLSRSYTSRVIDNGKIAVNTETDEFKSLFIGFEGSFTFSQSLKILLGTEIPFYSWSVRPMKEPPRDTLFFNARAGIIWTLPAGKEKK